MSIQCLFGFNSASNRADMDDPYFLVAFLALRLEDFTSSEGALWKDETLIFSLVAGRWRSSD